MENKVMSKIKAIRNNQDYEEALVLLGELLNKNPDIDSEEADQLSILSTLVESYEANVFPQDLPNAIDAIKFRMEQLDLRPADLVPYIGSASRVSEILSGKRSLTVDMIRELGDGLGIPTSALLKKPVPCDDNEFDGWDVRLVKQMHKRGYFGEAVLNGGSNGLLKSFFATASNQLTLNVLLRQSSYRSAPTTDPYALVAWSRYVLNQANKITHPKTYSAGTVTLEFMQSIARLSVKDDGPIQAQKALLQVGIILIIEPPLSRTRLDGAAILNDSNNPVIGLTLRLDRIDNFWFTLMHELAHVALHYDKGIEFFYDELEDIKGIVVSEKEREADELAGEALVPGAKWEVSPARIIPSPMAAASLANDLGVHMAIIAGKIRYESGKWGSLSKVVGESKVRQLFSGKVWE